jgi:hypothetical protein
MPFDLLLDENGDLRTANGDFVVGDATEQNKVLLLISQMGEWKQNPTVGIGIQDFIEDDNLNEMANAIRKGFANDGMKVGSVQVFVDGSFKIDAEYDN